MSNILTVEDRLNILDLFARYSWAMDTGDAEAMKEIFTEDCQMEGWDQVWVGARVPEVLMEVHHQMDIGVQHHAGNFVIEGDTNNCVVIAQNYGFHYSREGMTFRYAGYQVDKLVKRNGKWKIHRFFYGEWEGPMTVEGRKTLEALKARAAAA